MSSRPASFNFTILLFSMCAVWLSYPLWSFKGKPESEAVPEQTKKEPRFIYEAPQKISLQNFDIQNNTYSAPQVYRQLMRRKNMEATGFVENIIENPEIPVELRSRFLKEKLRLDALAIQHPDIAEAVDEKVPSIQHVDSKGNLSQDYKNTFTEIKNSGYWDELHMVYIRQLEEAANDESLPSEQRPTQEFLNRAKEEYLIQGL